MFVNSKLLTLYHFTIIFFGFYPIPPHNHIHCMNYVKQQLLKTFSLSVCVSLCLCVSLYLSVSSNINPPIYMDTPYRQLSWIYLTFINSWLLLNPTHLCPDWRFGLAPLIHSITDPHNLLSLVTMGTVTALAVYGVKHSSVRSRTLLLGLALMIIPFLPASNLFFPVGFVVAERVLYLPSMGFCMLVAYGAYVIHEASSSLIPRTFIKLFVVSLLSSLAAHSYYSNLNWESNVTLYTAGVRCNPRNGVMLTNLGIEHGRLKNFSFAETLYRTSIQVAPEHSRGYSNLGGLLEALKRYDEAEEVR